MAGERLTGTRRVRTIRPAIHAKCRVCPRGRDQALIRRHWLKLRYWPEQQPTDHTGKLLDVDWSGIRALNGLKIGELRIHDTIGGNDNLRIIFYEGDAAVRNPLPMVWVLHVMQKKRDDFTQKELNMFRARRLLVVQRFYV